MSSLTMTNLNTSSRCRPSKTVKYIGAKGFEAIGDRFPQHTHHKSLGSFSFDFVQKASSADVLHADTCILRRSMLSNNRFPMDMKRDENVACALSM